jgi:hypothetical protein
MAARLLVARYPAVVRGGTVARDPCTTMSMSCHVQCVGPPQTAMAITGMPACSDGSGISVTRLIRPDAPGFGQDLVPGAPRDRRQNRMLVRCCLSDSAI